MYRLKQNLWSAPLRVAHGRLQCSLFRQNIGWVTPKIIHFHYLKTSFLDQSIQKIITSILKKEAMVGWFDVQRIPRRSLDLNATFI